MILNEINIISKDMKYSTYSYRGENASKSFDRIDNYVIILVYFKSVRRKK